jgi:hypothetical protein
MQIDYTALYLAQDLMQPRSQPFDVEVGPRASANANLASHQYRLRSVGQTIKLLPQLVSLGRLKDWEDSPVAFMPQQLLQLLRN